MVSKNRVSRASKRLIKGSSLVAVDENAVLELADSCVFLYVKNFILLSGLARLLEPICERVAGQVALHGIL